MHIFTYRWPDGGLPTADHLAHLKELTGTNTLVFFQNMPQSAAAEFTGGTFRVNGGEDNIGNFAFSAEAGVMDRADWATFPLNEEPCALAVGIFGDTVINVDVTAEDNAENIQLLIDFIESHDKIIAVVGNFEQDVTITGFTDVKAEETDTTIMKVKAGFTTEAVKFTANTETLTNTPVAFVLSK